MAKCDPQIYARGEFFTYFTGTVEEADKFCQKLEAYDKEARYDWHNFAGRKVVKRLLRSQMWTKDPPSEVGFYWLWEEGRSPWIQHLYRHNRSDFLGYMARMSPWSSAERFRTVSDMAAEGTWFYGPLAAPELPEVPK